MCVVRVGAYVYVMYSTYYTDTSAKDRRTGNGTEQDRTEQGREQNNIVQNREGNKWHSAIGKL